MIDKNAPIEMKCPNCGKQFKRKVGAIQANPDFDCPHCDVGFNARPFLKDLADAERQLRDFGRNIGRRFR